MPDPVLRLTIRSLHPTARGRRQGTGQATINARVQVGMGSTWNMGNLRQRFNYRGGGGVAVGWQTNVNVRGAWRFWFEITVTDTAGRRLARFRKTLWRAFWSNRVNEMMSTRNMHLIWSLEVVQGIGGGRSDPNAIHTARECAGSTAYTTVSGRHGHMRVEFCPVMPAPADGWLPPRPNGIIQASNTHPAHQARNTGGAQILPTSPMNVLANPPIIPRLTAPDTQPMGPHTPEDMDEAGWANERNCARIEYTWYYPNTLRLTDDDRRLVWEKMGGDGEVAFIKLNRNAANGTENCGLKVGVYGTRDGEVTLGVRFRGALVGKYHAIVGPNYRLPCRINILIGTPGAPPNQNAYRPSATPAHCAAHLKVASRILRQMGITLAPDPDDTANAVAGIRRAAATNQAGVFQVTRVLQAETRNLTIGATGTVLAYNYNADALNFTYVHSLNGNITGVATRWPESNAGPEGTLVSDDKSPSTSWIRPSGISPDADADEVEMRIIKGFVDATHADMFGMVMASNGGNPGDAATAHRYGQTMAHEIGHMLCLGHRVEVISDATCQTNWQNGTLRPAADAGGRVPQLVQGAGNLGAHDGIFCDELWFPPFHNVMLYYSLPQFALDFDRVQARAARQSPLLDKAI